MSAQRGFISARNLSVLAQGAEGSLGEEEEAKRRQSGGSSAELRVDESGQEEEEAK